MGETSYRCEAQSAIGFVQQLACNYLVNGYHHYVVGELPERKDPRLVDANIVSRYDIEMSRFTRARRKRAGLANVHYVRYRRFFVLLATGPRDGHRFFEEHSAGQLRHIREHPIAFGGYSIGYHRGVDRRWHVSVRIHPERYRSMKAYLVDLATKRSAGVLAGEFAKLPFEPYAPVRRQLLALLRAVNRARGTAGLEPMPASALRLRRRIVKPFGDAEGQREGKGAQGEKRGAAGGGAAHLQTTHRGGVAEFACDDLNDVLPAPR